MVYTIYCIAQISDGGKLDKFGESLVGGKPNFATQVLTMSCDKYKERVQANFSCQNSLMKNLSKFSSGKNLHYIHYVEILC